MEYGIRTLDDVNVTNRTVLCRVDFNQPLNKKDGTLKSTKRIEAVIPTIKELILKKAKIVLLTHQGSDIEYNNFGSTKPHSIVLAQLLDYPVKYIDDICGPAAIAAIMNLDPGEVLLLENVRYEAEEQTLFEINVALHPDEQIQTRVIQKLAPLVDYYLCDAFAAAHRNQPSLCAFEYIVPSIMGRLFEKEYQVISAIMDNPTRPSVYILGGAKIADALMIMQQILDNNSADIILTGGLVANLCLVATGRNIGSTSYRLLEKKGFIEYIPQLKRILELYSTRIVLPVDLAYIDNNERMEVLVTQLPNDQSYLDIGSKTIAKYIDILNEAKTVFVNGPLGVFEELPSDLGTRSIWKCLEESEAYTVIGGGDSITAVENFIDASKISYICTGGGALIRFISGEELPVIKALRYSAAHFNFGGSDEHNQISSDSR